MSSATSAAAAPDTVLVVDFGAQYAQLIARRVREARVYSEIVPSSTPVAEMLARKPAAIILSGGPSSVYEPGAPTVDRALFEAGVPVFGMCYGFQLMAQALGGTVDNSGAREYGGTRMTVSRPSSTLFEGTPAEQSVWMSHGDACSAAPEGFTVTASTEVVPVAAFENDEKRLYGVQYHPEVMHSTHGQQVLEHFLYRGAGLTPSWTTGSVIEEQVAAIRERVGDKRAICGLSGGVDSAVAAALVQRAIGHQLTCVYVDHGLMRKGETEQVEKDFVAATGVQLKVVDAGERFLNALKGVSDPEEKRKIIGREFIRVFEQAQAEIVADAGPAVEFLVQGTLYPDVVESGGGTGTANIKSHHNVGGLPEDLEFQLVEPLRQLFKDEVREGRPLRAAVDTGWRRAIYVLQRRRSPVTMLEVFDTPPMSPNCVERPKSTVPTQALQLMNGVETLDHARYLAGRLIDAEGTALPRLVEMAYRRVYARPATSEEVAASITAIKGFKEQWRTQLAAKRESAPIGATAEWMALGDLIHVMLNSAEFSYVD